MLTRRKFAAAAQGPGGASGLLEGARALALTVLELALQPGVRAEVAREGQR